MSIIGPVFIMNPYGTRPVAAYDNSGGNPAAVEPLRARAVELNSIADVLHLVEKLNKMREETEERSKAERERHGKALNAVTDEAFAVIDDLTADVRKREVAKSRIFQALWGAPKLLSEKGEAR